MEAIRIVIIDDQTLFNDGLKAMLKNNHEIEVIGQVFDSRKAVAVVEKLIPDLVILDYNMPYINGLDLAREFRRHFEDLKILILSSHDDINKVFSFKKLGVNGFMNKSVLIDDVAGCIKAIVLEDKKLFPVEALEFLPENTTRKELLSKREIQILGLIKQGLNTKAIAEALYISFYTAETHRKNINNKLGLKNESELFKFIYDNNF